MTLWRARELFRLKDGLKPLNTTQQTKVFKQARELFRLKDGLKPNDPTALVEIRQRS